MEPSRDAAVYTDSGGALMIRSERAPTLAFRERETTQAAAYLVKRAGGRLNYTKLLKLLYLADRTLLVRYGKPITYDQWVSMRHGPVLSRTYDLIKTPESGGYWARHLATDGYDAVMREDPGSDDLSPAAVQVLEEVYEQFGGLDTWAVRDAAHDLPEWTDPGNTAHPITYRSVLEVEGFGQEEVDAILENIEAQDALDRLIAATRR